MLARLAAEFGFPRPGNPKDVFYCAAYVLLSAQTTLGQATAALRALRRRWPTAPALSRARPEAIHRAIRSCGFGATRTAKIRAFSRAVAARTTSLRALRVLEDAALETELVALPGVGFKSARMVAAMSSLGRDRFAIDTHVWRIAQRLGWIPRRRTDRKPTERQADQLEAQIPVAGAPAAVCLHRRPGAQLLPASPSALLRVSAEGRLHARKRGSRDGPARGSRGALGRSPLCRASSARPKTFSGRPSTTRRSRVSRRPTRGPDRPCYCWNISGRPR